MKQENVEIIEKFILLCLRAVRKYYRKWLHFMKHGFLKTFILFAFITFTTTFITVGIDAFLVTQPSAPQVDLNIDQISPESEGILFLPLITILPIFLFFEDLGIRLMPRIVFNLLHVGGYEVSPNPAGRWRIWIADHERLLYYVVSSCWNAALHLPNIVSANVLGLLMYFLVQFVIGFQLAKIFLRHGFWQSYTIHVAWDYLLFAIMFLESIIRITV